MAIKQGIVTSGVALAHPYEDDLSFLYGTIFIASSSTLKWIVAMYVFLQMGNWIVVPLVQAFRQDWPFTTRAMNGPRTIG